MTASETRDPGQIAMRGEHNHDVLTEWLDMSLTDHRPVGRWQCIAP